MARTNFGLLMLAAGVVFCASIGGVLFMENSRSAEFETRIEDEISEAREFGLRCPEKRQPQECEALCRAMYVPHVAWRTCVRGVIFPDTAFEPDAAPELAGGPSPEDAERIRAEAAYRECVGEDRPDCDRLKPQAGEVTP